MLKLKSQKQTPNDVFNNCQKQIFCWQPRKWGLFKMTHVEKTSYTGIFLPMLTTLHLKTQKQFILFTLIIYHVLGTPRRPVHHLHHRRRY